MKRGVLALAMTAFFAIAPLSCGDEEAKLTVNYAPGFVSSGKAMSVFGVYKDGRLSPEAWDDVGKRFSAALHSKDQCDVVISNGMRVSTPNLFGTLDDAVRAEGVTDELLDKVAPSATGDSILVITIAGRPPHGGKDGGGAVQDLDSKVGAPVTTTQGGFGTGGGGTRQRGIPRTSTGGGRHPGRAPNVFEISASLFSIREHKSVALVALAYTGASEEDAYARFLAKLSASFPGATCRGWNPDVKIDEDAIRAIVP